MLYTLINVNIIHYEQSKITNLTVYLGLLKQRTRLYFKLIISYRPYSIDRKHKSGLQHVE